jgi:alkanesulfonate monooxygenase SsuD/methylene tetrahydromethanopterin reductase-like flavin-dependent oxidoreductase (luciferase family)
MKFSVWPSPERAWSEIASLARTAEAQGWHGLWFADHLMPNSEDGEPLDGDVFECWSILAAVGAITDRIRLGSLVSPVTFHHPAVLAKRAAAVDHVSGGRAVLGIGAGWQVNEHRAIGVELPAPGERVTRFAEAIEMIAGMLHEERTTTDGSWFRATDLPAHPRPVQERLPILVGTASPRMARLTAQWADEWNTWGHPDEAARRMNVFTEACTRVGRDPATLHKSAQAMIVLTDDAERAEQMRGALPADRSIVGSAAEIVDTVGRYAEIGFDEFIVPDFTFGSSESRRAETFGRFWNDVATQL